MDFNPQFVATTPAWKAPCTIWRLHVPISVNWHKLFSYGCFCETLRNFTLIFGKYPLILRPFW